MMRAAAFFAGLVLLSGTVAADELSTNIKPIMASADTPEKLAALTLREGDKFDNLTSNIRAHACVQMRQKLGEHAYKSAALAVKDQLLHAWPSYGEHAQKNCAYFLIALDLSPKDEAPLLASAIETFEYRLPDPNAALEFRGLLQRLGRAGEYLDATETVRNLLYSKMNNPNVRQSIPALEAVVEAAGALCPSTHGSCLPLLLQARKKFAVDLEDQLQQESQYSNSNTIFDANTESDIAAFTKKFEAVICAQPLPVSAEKWSYYMLDGDYPQAADAKGTTIQILCPAEGL
jgi:hypothetical protein